MKIQLKTREQLVLMRQAGIIVADALAAMRDAVAVGVTTRELDAIASDVIRTAGAVHDLCVGEPRDRAWVPVGRTPPRR
jgi:methionyl aminopeptidase